MRGNIKFAIINPPIIKQQVAISDGHCKVDKPIIACPLVQPPAYLVPKPIIKPPITIIKKPRRVNKLAQENN
jgi:hypothetical protein